MSFRVATTSNDVIFRPFNRIVRERYGVYWRIDA